MSRQGSVKITRKEDEIAHSGSNAVTVGIRIRPPNNNEIKANMQVRFKESEDALNVYELDEHDDVVKRWPFDHVFGPLCTNSFIYSAVGRPIVESALDGYNTVMFMYGQTSSGKTFTLFGGNNEIGIVDHAMQEAFDIVTKSTNTEYVIKIIFVELYNEEIKDLLTSEVADNLKITEDPYLGPMIQNITEVNFTSVENTRRLLKEGDERRHFGVTNMNAHSSRSHVMVRLNIESRKVTTKVTNPLRPSWGKDKPNCFSTLNLVDLAGSEKADKAGTSGQSLTEGSYINKSLLTLGQVIKALSTGNGENKHVPYRNSKLTRLLASALGGNAKTCMIICISPASGNVLESLSTLRFAQGVKKIINQVQKNEIDDPRSLAMKLARQKLEIDNLRALLESSKFEDNEMLKHRALSASKKYRNLKFMVKNSSLAINALKRDGKRHLVKRVREDFKDALQGRKDFVDVVDEHSLLLENNLPKETKLLKRFNSIKHANTETAMRGDDGDDDDQSFFDSDSSDNGMNEQFFLDLGDQEETMELLETANLSREDVSAKYERKIEKMEMSLTQVSQLEKRYRHTCEDLTAKISEHLNEISRLNSSEVSLKQKLDRLQKKVDDEGASHNTTLDAAHKHIGTLEQMCNDKDRQIGNLQQNVLLKDQELNKLKQSVEALQQDLESANLMRKSFEDEAQRTRNELRTQMDRLRGNMHNMLQQGTEQGKVLEMQNSALLEEARQARDDCDTIKQHKLLIEQEMVYLRKELRDTQSIYKSHLEETVIIRSQLTKAQQALQSQRIELTQVQTRHDGLEYENEKLRSRITEILSQQNAASDIEQKKHADDVNAYKARVSELESDLNVVRLKLENQNQHLEIKSNSMIQQEQQFNINIMRLENKLAIQVKLYDELQKENSNIQSMFRSKMTNIVNENKALRLKEIELEEYAQSVKRFIEVQDEEYSKLSSFRFDENGDVDDEYNNPNDDISYDRDGMHREEDVEYDDYTGDDIEPLSIPNNASSKLSSSQSYPFSPKSHLKSPPYMGQRSYKESELDGANGSYHTNHNQALLNQVQLSLSKDFSRLELIQLGIKTFTCLLNFITGENIFYHNVQLQHELEMSKQIEKRGNDLTRSTIEIDTLNITKANWNETIKLLKNKEDDQSLEILRFKNLLLEKDEEIRALGNMEELSKKTCTQLELENCTIRIQLSKIKEELEDCYSENNHLKQRVMKLSAECEELISRNIFLNCDLDLSQQKLFVIIAERDELVRQFIGESFLENDDTEVYSFH